MSIEIAQKYGVGVTYKGDDGTLYFKDEAGNVTSLVQFDQLAKVSSNDTTAGYLNGKLVAGTNITLTENNNGGNETLTIAAAAAPVTSVNTKTGAVTLTNTDVGAAATSHTHAASEITSGTIATARLGSGTANSTTYLAGDQTYKAAVTSVNGSTGAVTVAATSHTHAAGDITSGTIATARLGSGTADNTTFLRGDNTWATPAGGSGGFSFYDVTLADAENTTSTIDVAKITVPANTWTDGQAITLDLVCDVLNQKGSSGMPDVYVKIGIFTSISLIGSWPDGFGTRVFIRTKFVRSGNNIYIIGDTSFKDNGYSYPLDVSALSNPPSVFGTSVIPSQSANFAASMDLKLSIRFDVANASYYLRPFHGSAYKTEKGASL